MFLHIFVVLFDELGAPEEHEEGLEEGVGGFEDAWSVGQYA